MGETLKRGNQKHKKCTTDAGDPEGSPLYIDHLFVELVETEKNEWPKHRGGIKKKCNGLNY